jgi:hypothetical protein
MCYKYLKDENNAKVYLGKAGQFFELYAKAEKTVLYDAEKATRSMYQSRKYGPLIKKPLPPIADAKAAIDQQIDAQRKQLEALSY